MAKAQRREFGRRLRKTRIDRGFSMKQLAGRVGISLSALGRYELGRRFPGLDSAVSLAEALDVPVDYLATGKGPEHRISPFTARVEEALEAIESLPRELREALAALFLPAAKSYVRSGERE